MQRGFFIEGATSIQDLSMNSIHLDFAQVVTPATQEQIHYLEQLQQKLPQTINQAGMFTTALYAGYHKTFLDFKHLDFIDLQIKAGITSPQAMSKTNQTLLQFPWMQNINFGYPIIITTSFGLLDWITLGCNGAVIPWQSTIATVPLRNNVTQNNILIQDLQVANVERGPLLTTSIYFEADHFHQNLSTIIAYCYTKSCAYTIIPIDQINTQLALVNQLSLLESWSLGSIYLEFNIDFACESKPNAPVLSFFCNIPITGQLCPETNIFGGACNLQLSYAF